MVVWSGGPLTPAGTKLFDGASNRSPSTCLKTPQSRFKAGRLKPFFANNVDIPFARARRLKPCPRKATVRSGKQLSVYAAIYMNSRIKSNNSFRGGEYPQSQNLRKEPSFKGRNE